MPGLNRPEPARGSTTVNRRDILRTATGLAAAAVVGTALIDSPGEVHAQSKLKDVHSSGQIGELGNFGILSFSWGMVNPFAFGGGGAGRVQMADITIVKQIDSLTPRLQFATARGEHFQRATVTVGDTGLTYEFEDVVLTGNQVGAITGEDVPVETISFAFARVSGIHGSQGFEWNVIANEGRLIP